MAIQLTNSTDVIEYHDTTSGYKQTFIKGTFRVFLRGEIVTLVYVSTSMGSPKSSFLELKYADITVPTGMTTAALLYAKIVEWDNGPYVVSIETVAITAGGNKTFTAATYLVNSGGMGISLVDSGDLADDTTVNMEISYDGTNFETMTDSAGEDITGIIIQDSFIQFSLTDIPPGAIVRPKFVTNTTGDVVVTAKY